MIKSELIQKVAAANPHLYQRDVERIVNVILEEIIAALARGDRVELRGFGAFTIRHRSARQAGLFNAQILMVARGIHKAEFV